MNPHGAITYMQFPCPAKVFSGFQLIVLVFIACKFTVLLHAQSSSVSLPDSVSDTLPVVNTFGKYELFPHRNM